MQLIDRSAYAKVLNSIIENKALTIPAHSEFLSSLSHLGSYIRFVDSLPIFLARIYGVHEYNQPGNVFVVDAFLKESQYKAPGNYTFKVQDMNPHQRKVLEDLIYKEGAYRLRHVDFRKADLASVPTAAFPNGLPKDGYIQFTVSSEPVVLSPGPSTSTLKTSFDAEEVTKALASKDSKPSTFDPYLAPEGLRLGDRTTIGFQFFPTPGLSVKGDAKFTVTRPGPAFSQISLPSVITELVQAKQKGRAPR